MTSVTDRTAAFQNMVTTYILLGVSVGSDLRLAQIEVHGISRTTDDDFFKELKYRYTTLRGFMRRWFSIYRYAHCRFVKVMLSFIYANLPFTNCRSLKKLAATK